MGIEKIFANFPPILAVKECERYEIVSKMQEAV
jgi:hypothetical protein